MVNTWNKDHGINEVEILSRSSYVVSFQQYYVLNGINGFYTYVSIKVFNWDYCLISCAITFHILKYYVIQHRADIKYFQFTNV